MKIKLRTSLALGEIKLQTLFLLLPCLLQAQPVIYKGLRISLFGFETIKQTPKSLLLRCNVANTGRYPVAYDKSGERLPPSLVIELDTQAVPIVLRGREQLLSEAIKKEKINLQPGMVRKKLDIKINFQDLAPDTLTHPPSLQNPLDGCPDLVFDTVFITHYTDKKMKLDYVVRNRGSQPTRLLGNSPAREDNMAINVYFSGSLRLTRGAVLGDGTFIREGRETVDGLLLPGQQLHGSVEVNLKDRTRFSPNLILELDPFQTVRECDKANNTWGVKVEF